MAKAVPAKTVTAPETFGSLTVKVEESSPRYDEPSYRTLFKVQVPVGPEEGIST